MGFMTPSPSPVPPADFVRLPFLERVRVLAQNWVTDGFGTPKALNIVYVLKMLGLYFAVGLAITAATTEHVAFTDPSTWFDHVVVYQKLAIWLMFLEVVGLGGAFGPLCGHFQPMLGNVRYWLRPGTIRMAPWSRLPGTGGDTRTVADVVLFAGVLAALVYPLVLQAEPVTALPAGTTPQELVPAHAFIPILVLMPLLGLRDKTIFLAARSEQYLPIMLFSAVLGSMALADDASPAAFVDLVVVFKIVIVVVWLGAGVSKLGQHFITVIPPMVSNAPGQPKALKRLTYRDVDGGDLRPSRLAWVVAHVLGTTVEIGIPLVLLLTTNATVAALGAVAMLLFHLYITSTFPLAVPLEWNVYFGYVALVMWIGFDPAVYNVWELSEPLWLVPILALLLFGPVLGHVRPDLVSFLPAMRQYAGNWAVSTWAMRPGVEERLNELPMVENQIDQLQRMMLMPYEHDEAEVMLQKTLAWRAMHTQGRGVYSVLLHHLPDLDQRTVREGELVCNAILGWNFGDGHLHDERLVAAVQRRLGLEPGDLVVVYAESQAMPWRNPPQRYRVIDAALGVVERGTWDVSDCTREQPWLPNGPIPVQVEWSAPGYVRGAAPSDAPTA